jgi:hypothetical protein
MKWFDLAPAWAREMFTVLYQQEQAIMAAVQVQQEDLDKFAADVESAVATVKAEIEALQLPPAQMDSLNKALSDLQALEPPAPTA